MYKVKVKRLSFIGKWYYDIMIDGWVSGSFIMFYNLV